MIYLIYLIYVIYIIYIICPTRVMFSWCCSVENP